MKIIWIDSLKLLSLTKPFPNVINFILKQIYAVVILKPKLKHFPVGRDFLCRIDGSLMYQSQDHVFKYCPSLLKDNCSFKKLTLTKDAWWVSRIPSKDITCSNGEMRFKNKWHRNKKIWANQHNAAETWRISSKVNHQGSSGVCTKGNSFPAMQFVFWIWYYLLSGVDSDS